jgi:hypothetical protein
MYDFDVSILHKAPPWRWPTVKGILSYIKHAFVGFCITSMEHMLYTCLSISVILNEYKIYKVSTNRRLDNLMTRTLFWHRSTHGTGSRRYTSHFHVVITGFKHLRQYGHQGLYCGTAEIGLNVHSQKVTACFGLTSVTYCWHQCM